MPAAIFAIAPPPESALAGTDSATGLAGVASGGGGRSAAPVRSGEGGGCFLVDMRAKIQ
jgi:hypothetical protein